MSFTIDPQNAQQLDQQDPLAHYRDQFYIPEYNQKQETYFVGHSLGLQPKTTINAIQQVLNKWSSKAVRGHFEGEYSWVNYHEYLTATSADLIGAKPEETIVMNTLTVNLHLMMVSFYRPTATRYKILIEDHAFPSDHYAVESQLKFHGFDPKTALIKLQPRAGEECLHHDDIRDLIQQQGEEIALILLPGVQYYTGQVLDIQAITTWGHAQGCLVGFDLAHAAGNIPLALHDWQVDFAVWCNYKYLNSGPGAVGGCFIHKDNIVNTALERFAGWWGQDKQTRFLMEDHFQPIPTAEGWQLSNPPVLSLAAIRASLAIFSSAGGIQPLREKSIKLTGYLAFLLKEQLADQVKIITPTAAAERGCQLSLRINSRRPGREVFTYLEQRGVATDWREPNVIRCAPVPLYNQYQEVYNFVENLKQCLHE